MISLEEKIESIIVESMNYFKMQHDSNVVQETKEYILEKLSQSKYKFKKISSGFIITVSQCYLRQVKRRLYHEAKGTI